jgi:Rap1a immunity proteins
MRTSVESRMNIAFALLILLTSFILEPHGCAAQAKLSGTDLRDWCLSPNNRARDGCTIYVAAFLEGIVAGQQLAQLPSKLLFCPPPALTAERAQAAVLEEMREHPEMLNQQAAMLVARALFDSYKCKTDELPFYGRKSN